MNGFNRNPEEEEEEEFRNKNPPTPCLWQEAPHEAPASCTASTQKTENQKENQAGHSPERTAEGQGGATGPGFTVHSPRAEGPGLVKVGDTPSTRMEIRTWRSAIDDLR